MKIKSHNSKTPPTKMVDGEKKFEFTLNLEKLREIDGTDISEKLFKIAQNTSNDFLSNAYFSVAKLVSELKQSNDSRAKSYISCLNSSESCSYVYWGCGSCGEDWARVDAYCGSGGSEPDYSWCEPC